MGFETYYAYRTNEVVGAHCPKCHELVQEHVPRNAKYTMAMRCTQGYEFIVHLHDVRNGVDEMLKGYPTGESDIVQYKPCFNTGLLRPGTVLQVSMKKPEPECSERHNAIVKKCTNECLHLISPLGDEKYDISDVHRNKIGLALICYASGASR